MEPHLSSFNTAHCYLLHRLQIYLCPVSRLSGLPFLALTCLKDFPSVDREARDRPGRRMSSGRTAAPGPLPGPGRRTQPRHSAGPGGSRAAPPLRLRVLAVWFLRLLSLQHFPSSCRQCQPVKGPFTFFKRERIRSDPQLPFGDR